jgi:hypothetical protein|tara:strand:- start:244 stop:807 length:564 start_codon:yes stop_codon:yes gene_type:complete
MQIQQILSEGSGIVLTQVEVIKDYGQKQGQTPHRAVHVKDSSGSTMLKFWGASSNQGFSPGQKFSVQAVGSEGSINTSEYNGKFSLNCNNCEVVLGDGSAQPPAAAPPQAAQPPAQPSPAIQQSASQSVLTADQLADAQTAHFARIYKRIQSIDPSADAASVYAAAATMTGSCPQWFFGEKYPGMHG